MLLCFKIKILSTAVFSIRNPALIIIINIYLYIGPGELKRLLAIFIVERRFLSSLIKMFKK